MMTVKANRESSLTSYEITPEAAMSKMSLIAYIGKLRKALLKTGLIMSASFFAQSAFAQCPIANANGFNVESLNIGTSGGKTIFFCKQEFTPSQLSYTPTEEALLTGKSRAISKGNTIQTFPLMGSVNLSGFSASDLSLDLNMLQRDFPNNGGRYNKKSLFNFYTKVNRESECPAEYTRMKGYLRNNATRFVITPASTTSFVQGNDPIIGTFKNAKLARDSGVSQLTADIELYHTNPGAGQYFTARDGVYCWLGVGTRLNMNPNNTSLKNSGNYSLTMGVVTQ
ncbi:hypothetical protein ACTXMK_13370 [Psychrobacter celer]|uniref:hypothetical protein n=1 Tax=Psychrobacter celer TaxID=306572 RepID=UPI003FD683CE